jgi:hypothetical protein
VERSVALYEHVKKGGREVTGLGGIIREKWGGI